MYSGAVLYSVEIYIKGSGGKFERRLKARGSAPQGLESVEGLSIRSWEVILTYADTLHSYCAHTNVTISFCISADDEHIAPSSRLPSSSQRPRRQGCGTVPCVSRRVRKDHHQPRPHPIRPSRTRAAASWPFCCRRSPHTARAQNRRSKAPTRRMLALSATALSTAMVSIMAAR